MKPVKKQQFEVLIEKYSPQLYAQIRSMVLSHDDANDVLQNTWLKAWKAFDKFRAEAAPSSWLYRIAYNEALQHLRHEKHRINQHPAYEKEWHHDETLIKTEEKLQQALKLLSPGQRAVFALRYFNDMPVRKTAEVLGLAEGSVKAQYHKAVQKIETYLKQIAEG